MTLRKEKYVNVKEFKMTFKFQPKYINVTRQLCVCAVASRWCHVTRTEANVDAKCKHANEAVRCDLIKGFVTKPTDHEDDLWFPLLNRQT